MFKCLLFRSSLGNNDSDNPNTLSTALAFCFNRGNRASITIIMSCCDSNATRSCFVVSRQIQTINQLTSHAQRIILSHKVAIDIINIKISLFTCVISTDIIKVSSCCINAQHLLSCIEQGRCANTSQGRSARRPISRFDGIFFVIISNQVSKHSIISEANLLFIIIQFSINNGSSVSGRESQDWWARWKKNRPCSQPAC